MGDLRKVGEGLRLIYVGNIIGIVALLCTLIVLLIPLLALLVVFVSLAGGVIALVGVVKLRNEHGDYMNALIACVLGIVFDLFSGGNSVFAVLMDLAGTICALLQVYFIIRGTNSFLRDRGCLMEVSMGDKAWKWQLISAVVGVAAGVLGVVILFVMAGLSFVLLLGVVIVEIAALVFYLSYLKASAAALSGM